MLIAYLDESGHEGRDLVILAGFLGNTDQWNDCEAAWKMALGRRKNLHMGELRWSKPDRIKKLLAVLGPIPHAVNLQAVLSTVRISDYEDLLDGTQMQKLMKGYFIALLGIINVIATGIPPEETFKLVLEVQNEYAVGAHQIFLGATDLRTPSGNRKFVSIEFIKKGETCLTEPADYLAYALLQQYRDANSIRFESCSPILKITQPALGRHHSLQREVLRDFVLGMIAKHPNLMRSIDTKPAQT